MWTRFWDMHTGGKEKMKFTTVFVEAPKDEAIQIFKDRFLIDPTKYSCCNYCGMDYAIDTYDDLSEASLHFRTQPAPLSKVIELKLRNAHPFEYADLHATKPVKQWIKDCQNNPNTETIIITTRSNKGTITVES